MSDFEFTYQERKDLNDLIESGEDGYSKLIGLSPYESAAVMNVARMREGNWPPIFTGSETLRDDQSPEIDRYGLAALESLAIDIVRLLRGEVGAGDAADLQQVLERLTAILGREAAYTGQELTWDADLNADQTLTPPVVEFGPLAVPPVAMPGRTRLARTWSET